MTFCSSLFDFETLMQMDPLTVVIVTAILVLGAACFWYFPKFPRPVHHPATERSSSFETPNTSSRYNLRSGGRTPGRTPVSSRPATPNVPIQERRQAALSRIQAVFVFVKRFILALLEQIGCFITFPSFPRIIEESMYDSFAEHYPHHRHLNWTTLHQTLSTFQPLIRQLAPLHLTALTLQDFPSSGIAIIVQHSVTLTTLKLMATGDMINLTTPILRSLQSLPNLTKLILHNYNLLPVHPNSCYHLPLNAVSELKIINTRLLFNAFYNEDHTLDGAAFTRALFRQFPALEAVTFLGPVYQPTVVMQQLEEVFNRRLMTMTRYLGLYVDKAEIGDRPLQNLSGTFTIA